MEVFKKTNLDDDGNCFACGKHNPHGLGMKVEVFAEDQSAVCRIVLPRRYQGWAGIAHGGIVATLLDEIMAHAVVRHIGQGVTTGMETTFRAPVPLQQELLVRGWIARDRGRMCLTEATVSLAEGGQLLAHAAAKFLMRSRNE
jgi:acyl-coenzyme A thioesterase PaaI-like protein